MDKLERTLTGIAISVVTILFGVVMYGLKYDNSNLIYSSLVPYTIGVVSAGILGLKDKFKEIEVKK